MKAPPAPWPRLSVALFYEDPRRAIDFLVAAFGFEVHAKIEGEGGQIVHSELLFNGALVMAVLAVDKLPGDGAAVRRSPRRLGGANTQSVFLYVEDVEAHCARARAAGATIVREPTTTDYGEGYWVDRGYGAQDLEGHRRSFAERLRG